MSGAIVPLFQYLEHEVIADIARRIKKTMTYTRTAELMAMDMQKMGFSPVKIRAEAMKLLNADADYQRVVENNTLEYKKSVKELIAGIVDKAAREGNEIVANAGEMSWIDDMRVWESAGKELTDKSFLPTMQRAFARQTKDTIKNLTRTTGFKTMSGYEAVQDAYRRELDKAMIKLCTGTFSQEKVINDVIHNLVQSGLRSIDFASGYSMQLDTAVKLAIRTGCNQIAAKTQDENIMNTGENLVYVSEHWGARNTGDGVANHEWWQGKVYFIKDGTNYSEEAHRIGQDRIMSLWYATGYSVDGSRENNPLGLHGYNCRHQHYVWFEGISSLPARNPEPAPVIINGKTYDYYAMTQKMRAMERNIRALKREKQAQEKLGVDSTQTNAKLRQKRREYKEFCEKCNVPERTVNLRVDSGSSDLTRTKAYQKYKSLYASTNNLGNRSTGKIVENFTDVTQEYLKDATPGKGSIIIEPGYKEDLHENEINTAKWIHDTYGGDIKLLKEPENCSTLTPDYEWNGKLWDLKSTTTAKAANSALRHGLKQIENNPGGIVLDYKDNEFSMDELQEIMSKRLKASAKQEVDIIIVKSGKTVKIIRYKK